MFCPPTSVKTSYCHVCKYIVRQLATIDPRNTSFSSKTKTTADRTTILIKERQVGTVSGQTQNQESDYNNKGNAPSCKSRPNYQINHYTTFLSVCRFQPRTKNAESQNLVTGNLLATLVPTIDAHHRISGQRGRARKLTLCLSLAFLFLLVDNVWLECDVLGCWMELIVSVWWMFRLIRRSYPAL